MKKMGSFAYLSCLIMELWSLKCPKNGSFFVLSVDDSIKLVAVFKWISKISFRSLRKCHELLGYELLLARCQVLELQELGISCWFSSFSNISALNITRTVTRKPTNVIFFWDNSIWPAGALKIFCSDCA